MEGVGVGWGEGWAEGPGPQGSKFKILALLKFEYLWFSF